MNKINYKSEIEVLKSQINKLKEEINKKEEEIKILKKEIEQKEKNNKIDINSSLNNSINEELKDKEIEIQKQKEIIINLKTELEEQKKELHNTKLSLRIMTDVKENRDRQIDELNEDLEGLKEKIENFENEKGENDGKYEKILDEKKKLNNELNNIKIEIDKEKILSNKKDNQINILNNNINDLNNLINNITEEKNTISEENKILRDEIKKLKDDNDINKQNIQKQEKENNLLKADKSQMIMRLSTLNDEKLKLRQSLNIFETKEEQIIKEIDKLKNEIQEKENIIINKSKENKDLFLEKERINDELMSLKKEIGEKDNLLKKKEDIIKELNEEIEVKNSQVENIIKNINDYELQLKGLKDEKQELIIKNKKYNKEIKEEKEKYSTLKNDYDNIKKENQRLAVKMSTYKEEEISNRICVEMNEEEMQREEEVIKLRQNIEELNTNINQKNQEIEKYKTSYLELKKKLDKISINNTVNDKSEKTLNEKDTEMSSVENEYKEILKENANLKNLISQLKEEKLEINTKYNNINNKYLEQEENLKKKEIELKNMKEVSQAMIEKEKKKLEEEENIDPSNNTIISSKIYKKLTWYLIYKYNPNNNKNDNKKPDENNYSSYIWVNGNVIRRDNLKKFNLFEDDEKKISELQEYIFDLQKKLERKEESISRLDYKNKKLNEQLQNKTASVKGFGLSHISDTDKNKLKNNFANSMASNEMISDIDKYKNILEQLNDSNKRETQLHNEIINLKTQLKKKEEFESGIPQDIKNIDNRSIDSGFLDEDIKESTNVGVLNFIKENSNNINNKKKDIIVSTRTENENNSHLNIDENDTFNYKAAEKKADEFLKEGLGDESDFNEIKQMQKQMKFIKDQLKETILKYDQLSEQVKELLKNVKCDIKIKPQISQICQILEISPQTTSRILNNKKGGILGMLKGK